MCYHLPCCCCVGIAGVVFHSLGHPINEYRLPSSPCLRSLTYFLHCSWVGGTDFAEWVMNQAYILKVQRYTDAIQRWRRRDD